MDLSVQRMAQQESAWYCGMIQAKLFFQLASLLILVRKLWKPNYWLALKV
jgi:hypothetical protein